LNENGFIYFLLHNTKKYCGTKKHKSKNRILKKEKKRGVFFAKNMEENGLLTYGIFEVVRSIFEDVEYILA